MIRTVRNRGGNRLPATALSLVMAVCAFSAQGQDSRTEYEVKSGYLFNYARFVQWPSSNERGPFVIGILVEDEYARVIKDKLRGATVNGRAIALRRAQRPEDFEGCQMVFIAASQDWKRGVGMLEGLPILTVGEGPEFAREGGMISMVLEDGRVKFEVNIDAVARGGLQVSSRLLQVGRIIRDPPDRKRNASR
jgi:hypothetical protein